VAADVALLRLWLPYEAGARTRRLRRCVHTDGTMTARRAVAAAAAAAAAVMASERQVTSHY